MKSEHIGYLGLAFAAVCVMALGAFAATHTEEIAQRMEEEQRVADQQYRAALQGTVESFAFVRHSNGLCFAVTRSWGGQHWITAMANVPAEYCEQEGSR